MGMTSEQFDHLVRKLEKYSAKHPRMYEMKLRGLAYLGYIYIFTVLFLLAIVIIAAVVITLKNPIMIKFDIILAVFMYLIIKSLKVRFDRPGGIPVNRDEIPAFFDLCDEVSTALHAPKIKQVLITNEFNAGVYQHPRLGMLGWHENYLIIGLPLMQTLSPAEFKAVLAHEFAHLSHAHGKFSNWIYRIRRVWNQMMDSFQDSWIFKYFFNWYAPYFYAYSFVYARTNEYEADRGAARVSGSDSMANALIRSNIYDDYLSQKFWPGIYKEAEHTPVPQVMAFTRMHLMAKEFDVSAEQQEEWLNKALKRETGIDDTHPSLSDRLKSLRIKPELPQKITMSAAEQYFGSYLPKLQSDLDKEWQEGVTESWKERYEYVQKGRAGMAEYEAKLEKQEPVTASETYQYARWVGEFRTEDDALPLYEKVLEENPDHVSALVGVGTILIKKGDECGAGFLEKAMTLDKDYVFDGTRILYYFYMERDEKDKAEKYYEQAQGHSVMVSKAEHERSDIFVTDEYIGHGLDNEALDKLRDELRKYPYVEKAYMVRKKVEHFADKPFYVMGMSVKLSPQDKKAEKKNITFKDQFFMMLAGVSEDERMLVNKRSEIAQNVEFAGETIIFVINTASRKKIVMERNKAGLKRKYGLGIGGVAGVFYTLRYGWGFTQVPDDIAQPENLIYTR